MHIRLNDNNTEELTRPIFEKIHESYAKSNYDSLLSQIIFSDKMKSQLTEDIFQQSINNIYSKYGELVYARYLGYVERDAGHQVLWKCRYTTNTEEVLWQIYFSKTNTEHYEVTGLWFGN